MHDNTKNLEAKFNRLLRKYNADLNIDNRELMDVLYNLEDRRVAAKLMHRIVKRQIDSYMEFPENGGLLKDGKKVCLFPVITDTLKSVLASYKVDFKDTDEEAEDKFWRLCKMAFKTHDHILIGHEMQLDDYQISIYDAICGKFLECYNPRMLNVTREFVSYLQERSYIETEIKHNEDGSIDIQIETSLRWKDELKSIYDKYNAHPLDEDKAISYLFDEVLTNVLYTLVESLYSLRDND